MIQYIYTGECSDCGTEHRREWRSEWRGPDGETSYAADCRVCGPGHEIHMSPDLLPNDDDDGDEEPGAMCRRALAKAEASVDLIRQVATMICRPGELERLEADEASRHNVLACAREIIALVRATPAPDTITLSRDKFTTALHEAAAQGMDRTSGPSCGEAEACRDVADEIVEAIEAGRFSPDTYVYAFMEEQKAIQRARQGAES